MGDQCLPVQLICPSCGASASLPLGMTCGDHRPRPLPIHRTEAGYPRCATCDGGGCPDCTDPA